MSEWFKQSSFYHIYPLGYCGCPKFNDFSQFSYNNRLNCIEQNMGHILDLGVNAIYFGPVFESMEHGYDTVDFLKIDRRLGTNALFKTLCKKLHQNNIRVILDGVFNHVGRNFKQFIQVREGNKDYYNWFHISEGNTVFNDGFYYEAWEGHYELVKLNLCNPEVRKYLLDCVSQWIKEFDIDGLRLDVAYCLDRNFLKELYTHCKSIKSDFWIMGEVLDGNYNDWIDNKLLDSVTNYSIYNNIYSSFNDGDMFEISRLLEKQFGKEDWCMYTDKLLYSFVDNHDVSRIGSTLLDSRNLPLVYTLLFTMPGIPSIYYGSEYGTKGNKEDGDDKLRPEFGTLVEESPEKLSLLATLKTLIQLRNTSSVLSKGDFCNVLVRNKQYVFTRNYEGKTVIILINADDSSYNFEDMNLEGDFEDIFSNQHVHLPTIVHVNGHCMKVLTNE